MHAIRKDFCFHFKSRVDDHIWVFCVCPKWLGVEIVMDSHLYSNSKNVYFFRGRTYRIRSILYETKKFRPKSDAFYAVLWQTNRARWRIIPPKGSHFAPSFCFMSYFELLYYITCCSIKFKVHNSVRILLQCQEQSWCCFILKIVHTYRKSKTRSIKLIAANCNVVKPINNPT